MCAQCRRAGRVLSCAASDVTGVLRRLRDMLAVHPVAQLQRAAACWPTRLAAGDARAAHPQPQYLAEAGDSDHDAVVPARCLRKRPGDFDAHAVPHPLRDGQWSGRTRSKPSHQELARRYSHNASYCTGRWGGRSLFLTSVCSIDSVPPLALNAPTSVIFAKVKIIVGTSMSAYRFLELEQVPRVRLFAD